MLGTTKATHNAFGCHSLATQLLSTKATVTIASLPLLQLAGKPLVNWSPQLTMECRDCCIYISTVMYAHFVTTSLPPMVLYAHVVTTSLPPMVLSVHRHPFYSPSKASSKTVSLIIYHVSKQRHNHSFRCPIILGQASNQS